MSLGQRLWFGELNARLAGGLLAVQLRPLAFHVKHRIRGEKHLGETTGVWVPFFAGNPESNPHILWFSCGFPLKPAQKKGTLQNNDGQFCRGIRIIPGLPNGGAGFRNHPQYGSHDSVRKSAMTFCLKNRDPYIIHLSIALSMVVSPKFSWQEPCFTWAACIF